jgi:hypothetical protein
MTDGESKVLCCGSSDGYRFPYERRKMEYGWTSRRHRRHRLIAVVSRQESQRPVITKPRRRTIMARNGFDNN